MTVAVQLVTDRRAAPAPLGRRVGAYLLDGAFSTVAGLLALGLTAAAVPALAATTSSTALLLLLVLAPTLVPLVVSTAYAVVAIQRTASVGATPGQQLLGIEVVDADTGDLLPLGRAWVRSLVLGLVCGFTAGIGAVVLLVLAANDRTGVRRLLHDRAAGSVVVDARAATGAPPQPRTQAAPLAQGAPAAPVAPSGLTTVTVPGAAGPPLPPAPTSASAPEQAAPLALPVVTPHVPVQEVPPPEPPPPLPPPRPRSARSTPATGLIDAVPGLALPPPSPESPVGAAVSDHAAAADGADEDDEGATRHVVRRRAAPTAPWVLLLPGGVQVPVSGTALVGRNPQPRPGEEVTALVPVEDPERRVSKTHALLHASPDSLSVTDRGSTNGTQVRHSGGRVSRPAAGEPVQLSEGDAVVLGAGPELLVQRGR